jgi:hypothetical protein
MAMNITNHVLFYSRERRAVICLYSMATQVNVDAYHVHDEFLIVTGIIDRVTI